MQHRTPDQSEITEPPFLTVCHESVRALYRYWHSKRNGRLMPSRRDIDPLEMKPWLAHLMLVDVLPTEPRYVYRLVGTGEVAQRRYDPTGRPVSEAFFSGTAEETLSCYDAVVKSRQPFFLNAPYSTPFGKLAHDDIIFLPLSDDDEIVNMILVFTHMRVKDYD
jgi:hypothetical protein